MAADTLINYDIPFHKSGLPGIRTSLGKPIILPVESSLVFNCGVYDALGNFEASPSASECVIKLHNVNADGSLGSQIVSASGSITGSKTLAGWKAGGGHASVEIASTSLPISTFTGSALIRMSLWLDTDMLVQDHVLLLDVGSSIIAGGTLVFDSPPVGGGTIRGWWDASQSADYITTSSGHVVSWAAVEHVTVNNPITDNGDTTFVKQSDPSRPNLQVAGLNGLDYVRFNSSQSELLKHSSSGDQFMGAPSSSQTICLLQRIHFSTANNTLFVGGNNDNGPISCAWSSSQPRQEGATANTHGTSVGTSWHAVAFVFTGTGAATNRVELNRVTKTGTWVVSGGAPTVVNSNINLNNGTNNLDIAEFLIVDGAMSSVDFGLLIDWWNDKWGLAL